MMAQHELLWCCENNMYLIKLALGDIEVAQELKSLATKPDNLSSILRAHIVGENQLPQVALCLPHMCCG